MEAKLFTTYYREANAARRQELEACLLINTGSCEVYVRSEINSFQHGVAGVRGICIPERATYADMIRHANEQATGGLIMIANTDIIIPMQSLAEIDLTIKENEVYALTRWDITPKGITLFDACYSQDVWAFRGPPKQDIGGDYFFGVPGVDNRFAHELDAAGYKVLNPSKTIRTYHLHLSGVRNGNKPENRVPGPYLFVKPHALGEEPQYSRPSKISKRASQYQQ